MSRAAAVGCWSRWGTCWGPQTEGPVGHLPGPWTPCDPPHRLPSTPRGGGRWSRVAWPATCLLALLFCSSATDSSLRQAGIWHEGPPVLHGSDSPSVRQPLHQQPRGPRVPQSLHPRSLLVQPLLYSAPASLCAVCVRVVGSGVREDVHILSQILSGPPTLPSPRPRCPGVCPWPELTRSPESAPRAGTSHCARHLLETAPLSWGAPRRPIVHLFACSVLIGSQRDAPPSNYRLN